MQWWAAGREDCISPRCGRADTHGTRSSSSSRIRADATWGFGVVFSDRALEFLRDDDPGTVDLISPHMETWRDITVVHSGDRIVIDGIGFSAIGRLELLQLLQSQARAAGVVCRFEKPIRAIDELAGFDLIVAADGVNSLVRRSFEGDFAFSLSYLTNKFIWYGTTHPSTR